MQPSLSVIIPFHNKSALTIRAITSLLETQSPLIEEILLVNNASAKPDLLRIKSRAQALKRKYSVKIRMLSWNKPFNWQRVNNFAARKARGRVLCFLNNDVRFDRDSRDLFLTMVRIARKKNAGVVGCLMRYPDGTVQHAGGHPDRGFCHSHFGGPMRAAFRRDRPHKYLTGACHVISAAKFRKLGGYDPGFKLLGGDVDLCARAISSGLVNWIVGSSSFIHLESRTRRQGPVSPDDFRRLYYSMMAIYSAKDGVTISGGATGIRNSSLERYYGFPISKLREMLGNWLGNGLEFLPGVPHQRSSRSLIFCDGLTDDQLGSLLSRVAGARNGALLVGHDLSIKTKARNISIVNLSEILAHRRVFWIDVRLNDRIWASRGMMSAVKRSFPGHKVREIDC